jgi:hypothetical protein
MEERGCQNWDWREDEDLIELPVWSKLRIRCLGVFSVCTCRSELIGHLSWRILLLSFTVPEDVRYDFPNKSLHLEFILFILLYTPDLAPSDFHLFLVPWRMISKDAVFRMTTSCNTACEQNSDVSAKSFSRPVYRVSRKGGKIMLIIKILWKNNLNFVKVVPVIYV